MRETNGLIFMTALVPTIGHDFLIDFASRFVTGNVHVILSGRSFEPVTMSSRTFALARRNVFIHNHVDDNAPQNPKSDNDPQFWEYWKSVVNRFVYGKIDYVFASEAYGSNVAQILNADFIPVDIERSTFPVKGTTVRSDLLHNSDQVNPLFRSILQRNVILFGPESCGKTTMAKRLAKELNGTFISEWARPYLEYENRSLTEHQMRMIVHGQYAQELAAKQSSSKMLLVKDTNLVSTLGFYRLWGFTQPPELRMKLQATMKGLYIVMNDNIPFEADPIRYGGDKRESGRQYWIDLLEELGREYVVVKSTDHEEQFLEIKEAIYNYRVNNMTLNEIQNFVRD